jgi:hypothetical protein
MKKRGLGQIHFPSDQLHPVLLSRRGQQANRRRITREQLVSESIDLIH